jgi:hypothetical protein
MEEVVWMFEVFQKMLRAICVVVLTCIYELGLRPRLNPDYQLAQRPQWKSGEHKLKTQLGSFRRYPSHLFDRLFLAEAGLEGLPHQATPRPVSSDICPSPLFYFVHSKLHPTLSETAFRLQITSGRSCDLRLIALRDWLSRLD